MKTRLVRVGNSHAIRIPKPLIEQAGLHGELDIEVEDQSLVIRSAKKPRAGWEAAFQEMAQRGDDRLLNGASAASTRFDQDDWQW